MERIQMLNFIDNWLMQGDHRAAVDTCLNTTFIDAVIFLGWNFPYELRLIRSLKTPIVHIPMSDSEQENEKLFTIILNVIEALTSRNKIVFVCCEAGISRSPTICLLYLCAVEEWTFEAAEKQVKQQNSAWQPEPSLYAQIKEIIEER